MMVQRFPRPDRYLARCGTLTATVAERSIEGAPRFLRGLRAAFVTDPHVRPRTTRAQLDALAAKVAALRPDLLLLGGDYSDDAEGACRFFEVMARIQPPLGGYGVIGNNDAEAWAGRYESLRAVMARAGFSLLINASARVDCRGGTLIIGGVDEHRYGAPNAAGLYPAASGPNAYRILLSHYPIMPAVAPDLMLSGHTHGGQFNLLGLTPFAIGFERIIHGNLAPMAISGLHDVNGMRLLVSKGIGASRLQLRAGVRPEVDLIRF